MKNNPAVNFALHRPWLIHWSLLVVTLILTAMIARIQVDTDPENMLPSDQPERVQHNQTKAEFGLWDTIVVGMVNDRHPDGIYNPSSLAALKQLSDGIRNIDGVIGPDMMSLSTTDNITQEGIGTIRFNWLMQEAPQTRESALAIRAAVERLPLLANTLVSGDGRAAGIYVPIVEKHESYRISNEIRALVDELNVEDEFHITGLPVAEDTFGVEMFVQMAISAPLAALVIYLLMLWFFRSASMVAAPMLMAMATVLITMGALIGLGFTVHIMSSMIPIFLMPIAVVDSVHLLSEFADRYRPGDNPKTVVRSVLGHLFKPMLFTSITSAVGFLSLLFTPIPPVQIFGAFVAFGILLAFGLTITFIPAYLATLNPERLQKMAGKSHGDESRGMVANAVRFLGRFSLRFSKPLIALFVVLGFVSWYGIQQIQINDNPVRWFEKSHPIRVADRVLNEHFSGTYNAFLVLEQTELERVLEPLDDAIAGLPETAEIKPELIDLLADDSRAVGDRLQQMITLVDDAAFFADDALVDRYDELLFQLEEAATDSRYFQSPDALGYIEQLQSALDQSGYVGKSSSVADLVKTVYRELQGGEAEFYTLPGNSRGVAQTLLSFQSSHRPQDLWHMVTPDYASAAVWLQLKSGDNQDMSKVIEAVDRFVADNPPPQGVDMHWAGLTYVNVVWQDAMVAGMVGSLISAFVVVLIIMTLLFRSVIFGILAMVPLSLTIALIYGVIGLIGKDYDMPIAVLSSLTLGLSVDFAIHFLQRLRELVNERGWSDAIREIFEEPGRAISRNAIVIAIGFTPLLLAPLVPYQTVGIFLASIMAVSCLVTLMMLPAIISPLRRLVFGAAVKPTNSQGEDA